MTWTPHDLQIFLHHAVDSSPWPKGDTPAYRTTVHSLLAAGLFHDILDPTALTKTGQKFLMDLVSVQVTDVEKDKYRRYQGIYDVLVVEES